MDVEHYDHVISERVRAMKRRSLTNFTKDYRDVLIDLDDAYTTSRYVAGGLAKEAVREMIGVAEELFRLLEEVERNVLG